MCDFHLLNTKEGPDGVYEFANMECSEKGGIVLISELVAVQNIIALMTSSGGCEEKSKIVHTGMQSVLRLVIGGRMKGLR